ncbi:MAG: hypothetical protein LLF75_04705 [Eubacteriales bacterium]|nr:hypothetical protein [Eubacteriales bacterium]
MNRKRYFSAGSGSGVGKGEADGGARTTGSLEGTGVADCGALGKQPAHVSSSSAAKAESIRLLRRNGNID